ncbi:MAG: DapH/DapD/GlmU-related protein [Candidatus Thermoplasmatota archaeon]
MPRISPLSKICTGAYIAESAVIGHPGKDEREALLAGDWSGVKGAVIGERCIVRDFTIIYAGAELGAETQTGHSVLVREGATIGRGCTIGTGTIIENDAEIGDRVSIQSGVFIPTKTVIEDDVFIGPRACLTNDKYMGRTPHIPLRGPQICRGARIGANATIHPGIRIGREGVVGSGAVVTRDVEEYTVVVGMPAHKIGIVPPEHRRF